MIRSLLLAAALGPAHAPPVQRPTGLPQPTTEEPSDKAPPDEQAEPAPEAEPAAEDTNDPEGPEKPAEPKPGEPTEPAAAPEEPAKPDAAPAEPPAPVGDARPWRRKGLMFAGSVGVTHCFQAGCDARGHLDQIKLRPSPLLRIELGYRPIPWLAALVSGLVAYHPMKVQEAGGFTDAEANGVSLSVGPALYAFPVTRGRLDPYVSVFAGYVQYRTRLEETEGGARWATTNAYTRGVIRLGAGLSVHMSPSTAFGFRLDQNFPFAGIHCEARQPVPTSSFRDYAVCTTIRDAAFEDTQGLPMFWEFSIHAIETFDVLHSAKKRRHRRAQHRKRSEKPDE